MIAIKLENLGLRYPLQSDYSHSLKDSLNQLILGVQSQKPQHHWAFRNISHEFRSGSVTCLWGANGSGKSSLLKVITRVLHPSEGRLWTTSSISSLLDIGAGFDYELSGTQNINLLCALAGLSPKETRLRLAQIADFSELGSFLDIKVSRYSMGMFARLAFSIAIYSSNRVLVLDEILGVGDLSFQKKCFQKISEMKQKNHTLLIVSHDPATVEKIADEILVLKNATKSAQLSKENFHEAFVP